MRLWCIVCSTMIIMQNSNYLECRVTVSRDKHPTMCINITILGMHLVLIIPVMAILQDHLEVPSRTLDSAWSMLSMWVSGSTVNVVLSSGQLAFTTYIQQNNQTEIDKGSRLTDEQTHCMYKVLTFMSPDIIF